jgi:membrane protease YdiL (CAAX protease family)
MTEYAEGADVPLVVPIQPQTRGRPVLAWSVIVFFVAVAVLLRTSRSESGPHATEDTVSLRVLEIQAKYLVGVADWFLGKDPKLYHQVQAFNSGPLSQRLRFIILAGELEGPAEARKQLQELDQKLTEQEVALTPNQAVLRAILDLLYADYEHKRFTAPSLHEEERERLRTELGWFGELALAPTEGSDRAAREAVLRAAYRTVLALLGVVLGFALLALAGLGELVGFVALLLGGKLRGGLDCGVPYGGIYAETFALWLVLFSGLTFLAGRLALEEVQFLPLAGGMLLSLGVLAWPVLRGVPWQQVRQDIGLCAGRKPVLEPVIGLGGYAMTLPLLAVGVLMVIVLLSLQHSHAEDSFGPISRPDHPATEWVAHSGWWGRLQVLLLASGVAPLVEETMFRGVLYRHLREASVRLGNAWSIVLSATVVSFIFAVIHPQGVVAVPALMALAYGFTLLREWRGTLIPSMVAHGVNNAVVMALLMVLMSD